MSHQDDRIDRLLAALPMFAPSAAFAKKTLAAFEVAWQRQHARTVARALFAGAALSLASLSALIYALPITALNAIGHFLAEVAAKLRIVTHVAHGLTRLGPQVSTPLLVVLVLVCLSTTLLLERSVRLGRRTT